MDTFLGGELGLGHALVTHMVVEFRKDEGVDITKDSMAPRQCMSQLKGQVELLVLLQAEVNLPYVLVNMSGLKT